MHGMGMTGIILSDSEGVERAMHLSIYDNDVDVDMTETATTSNIREPLIIPGVPVVRNVICSAVAAVRTSVTAMNNVYDTTAGYWSRISDTFDADEKPLPGLLAVFGAGGTTRMLTKRSSLRSVRIAGPLVAFGATSIALYPVTIKSYFHTSIQHAQRIDFMKMFKKNEKTSKTSEDQGDCGQSDPADDHMYTTHK